MAPGLLSLPPEIIIEILVQLSYLSLFATVCTCRTLRAIITTSPRVQYALQASLAAVTPADESPTLDHVASRLRALRTREKNWSKLHFTGTTESHVGHRTSGIYDLTAGVYLLGESGWSDGDSATTTKAIHYVRLPSKPTPSEEVQWKRIDVGEEIIDVGLNVVEHDLIVIATRALDTTSPSAIHHTQSGTPNFWVLRLHLLSLSTGASHPLARQPVLYLGRAGAGNHRIRIEIIGQLIILLILHPPDREGDEMVVYDWFTGDLLMRADAGRGIYTGFTLLTHDTIVLPNHRANCLDIVCMPWLSPAPDWTSNHAPIEPIQEIKPILSLELPPLQPGVRLVRSTCRGEPNPHAPRQPLHPSSAENAIVIFKLFFQDRTIRTRGPYGIPLAGPVMAFAFVVHRRALCELMHLATGREHTGAAPDHPSVPWSIWGPQRTRWFEGEDIPGHWIATTCGQRYVNIPEDREPDERACIYVSDFNPLTVKRFIWETEKRVRELANRTRAVTERNVLHAASVWKCPIVSLLPYVYVASREQYEYQSILVDEGRVIGMKVSD
ncbi:hypothetical protein PUNSTDRAFT_74857 [Punctularia strigosozonata HHB-11173 SS5]|uniref:F-box domain-containing protein n=1 Tax=Punctularia strigosozonata (strain HHB-11173) TaxID=741275 RepID=R7S4A3_PUNST|nr:uncharacterized protein PUNSTDRAFT_74857 [Punctularia strigosozonata HHB-11173 SS5]EIN05053.1 hypothetical protein PUNSTDRAFT_74857 [Punctularia strigosozonata HHB-11173 SS5]